MVTMNGLNLVMRSHTETCHHLRKSKLFKVELCLMRHYYHKNGTPSEARRPRLVPNIRKNIKMVNVTIHQRKKSFLNPTLSQSEIVQQKIIYLGT